MEEKNMTVKEFATLVGTSIYNVYNRIKSEKDDLDYPLTVEKAKTFVVRTKGRPARR